MEGCKIKVFVFIYIYIDYITVKYVLKTLYYKAASPFFTTLQNGVRMNSQKTRDQRKRKWRKLHSLEVNILHKVVDFWRRLNSFTVKMIIRSGASTVDRPQAFASNRHYVIFQNGKIDRFKDTSYLYTGKALSWFKWQWIKINKKKGEHHDHYW